MFKKISLFFKTILGSKPCRDIDELIAYIKPGDIYGLSFWIQQNIVYRKDTTPAEEWKAVNKTIADKSGDCEDIALVGYRVIKSWSGWSAFLGCYYWGKGGHRKGHAICCFERPDMAKGFIDGGVVLKSGTWTEIFRGIKPEANAAMWVKEDGSIISYFKI